MPRIPIDQNRPISARPMATPFARQNFDTGASELAKGLFAAGDAVDEGMREEAKKQQEAKQKADAVAANDALTQFQRDNTHAFYGDSESSTPAAGGAAPGDSTQHLLNKEWETAGDAPAPYLGLRGKEATEGSADTLEWLETRRQGLEEKLSNNEQKELFRKHSQRLVESAHETVERHAFAERKRAEVASLEARQQTTLQDIANKYTDDVATEKQAQAVEGTLRAFALSPEDADSKAAGWRAQVAETRLNQYLGANDWKGAQAVLDKAKGSLPAKAAAQFQRAIDSTKRDGVADAIASEIAKQSTSDDGRIDAETALQRLDASVQGDVKVKDEARQRLKQYIVESDAAWERETKRVSSAAYSAFNQSGWRGIPGPLKEELNARNPQLYDRLHDDSERKFRQRGLDGAEARREQAERDRIAKNSFLELPASAQAETDVDEFLAGRGASPGMASEIKVHRRKAGDVVQKGEAASETEFVKQAKAAAQGIVRGKDALKTFEAEALLEYRRMSEEKKRAPSGDESTKAIGGLLLKGMTGKGWFGPSEEFGFQRSARERKEGAPPAAPAAAPAQPVRKRIRDAKGRLGWWDGVSPLDPGVTEVTGG